MVIFGTETKAKRELFCKNLKIIHIRDNLSTHQSCLISIEFGNRNMSQLVLEVQHSLGVRVVRYDKKNSTFWGEMEIGLVHGGRVKISQAALFEKMVRKVLGVQPLPSPAQPSALTLTLKKCSSIILRDFLSYCIICSS